jgi:hypothetical protein
MAGCSNKQAATIGNVNSPGAGANGQAELPLPVRLAIGTLKLEGTDQAVTSEQAAELLPLWKATNSLSDADNMTPQELEGLYKQIQRAMTPEQMQAIQSMDLSGSNIREIAKELGLDLPQGASAGAPADAPAGAPGELSQEQQATLEASRQSSSQQSRSQQNSSRQSGQMPQGAFGGGPPQGGFPGGEGGFPGGGFQNPSRNSGDQTTSQEPRGGFGAAIYQAVIDLLEKKIQ